MYKENTFLKMGTEITAQCIDVVFDSGLSPYVSSQVELQADHSEPLSETFSRWSMLLVHWVQKAATSISTFLQISLVYVFHRPCVDSLYIFAMILLGDDNIYQLVGTWKRVMQIYKLFVCQHVGHRGQLGLAKHAWNILSNSSIRDYISILYSNIL